MGVQGNPISQYMHEVQRYYKEADLEGRLIRGGMTASLENVAFLATDDPDVFGNATRLYPQYKFIKSPYTVPLISWASREGVESISYDVMYLANCDFVVCTFSSSVCSLVYELMLTNMERKGDRTDDVHSLDMSYFIHGENIQKVMLYQGARLRVLQYFLNGSVQLTTGEVVSKYLLDKEPQITPGVL